MMLFFVRPLSAMLEQQSIEGIAAGFLPKMKMPIVRGLDTAIHIAALMF